MFLFTNRPNFVVDMLFADEVNRATSINLIAFLYALQNMINIPFFLPYGDAVLNL